MKTPLLGGAYASRSSNLAAQRMVNLYLEMVETKEGKEAGALYSTPGLLLLATLGAGPVRGLHQIDSGKLYAVSGNGLYALDSAFNATLLGTLVTSSGPVFMIDNGNQLAVFDGSNGYLYVVATATFSALTLPFSGPLSGTYQDGFGLVNPLGTQSWYQSNYKDLSTWQSLNFGTADSQPDAIVAMVDMRREVWLLGQSSTEVWVNGGNSGFAFQRLQGVFIEAGCGASLSACKVGDSICWLGVGKSGGGVVYRSAGYQEKRISTHAVETAIQSYAVTSDAIGISYQQGGHTWYCLTFPSANVTWCWDESTGLWHQRAGFSAGSFTRWAANCYAFGNGVHVVGDYASGNLYQVSLETYTDNGQPRKWLRSWRALPPGKAVKEPVTFDALQIDLETGVTVPAGTNPQIALRWSDDGGNTWSNEHLAAYGQTGATANRVKWKRLGQTRDTTGLDRIFEISSSDPVRAALLEAEIEVS